MYKLNNNWIEGSSIDVFDGGFGSAVPISGYTFLPFTDVEQRRNRETFPYPWLGYNCGSNGNGCGNIPDTNPYWGGAGDNTPQPVATVTNITAGSGPPYAYTVTSALNPGIGNNDVQLSGGFKCSGTCTAANGTYSTTASTVSSFQFVSNTFFSSITTYGTAQLVAPVCLPTPTPGAACVNVDSTGLILTYVSGPQFHDSSSSWNAGSKTVLVNNDGNKYKISALGSGLCPTSCPTTISLKSALIVSGAPLTNVPFVFNGNSIVRKNCDEMKSALRVVYDGNVCENVDNSGGQNGVLLTETTRNNSGGAIGQNYQANITDVTFSNDIWRNGCNGLEFDARSSGVGDGGGVSWSMRRVSVINNLLYNVTKTNPNCNTESFGFYLTSANQNWTATITELPDGQHAQAVATSSLDVGAPLESDVVTSTTYASGVMTVIAPNTFIVGEAVEFLDTVGSPATPTPSCIVGGSDIQIVATVGTGAGSCGAAGTCFTVKTNGCSTGTVSPSNGATQGPVGYQVLNIAALDPVYVQGSIPGSSTNPGGNCGAFTTPTSYQYVGGKYIASGLGPLATIGSTPWNGTWTSGNYSVTYPWIATPGAMDNSGTCVLTNLEGGPGYMTIQHTTLITDAVHPIGEGPALFSGPIYMLKHLFQNCVALGSGGWSSGLSGIGEGSPTEQFVYDPNSMSADYLV